MWTKAFRSTFISPSHPPLFSSSTSTLLPSFIPSTITLFRCKHSGPSSTPNVPCTVPNPRTTPGTCSSSDTDPTSTSKWIKPSLMVTQFLSDLQKKSESTSLSSSTNSKPLLVSRHPWMSSDHPMLLDDYQLFPPFVLPNQLSSVTHTSSSFSSNSNSNSSSLSTSSSRHHDSFYPSSSSSSSTASSLNTWFRPPPQSDPLSYTSSSYLDGTSSDTYEMISVLRRRRVKMNKHKLRKLRKRTKSQRR